MLEPLRMQGIQTEFSRKACAWLARFEDAGLDHGHIDGFDLRLAEANGRCRDVVAEAFQVRPKSSVVRDVGGCAPHGAPCVSWLVFTLSQWYSGESGTPLKVTLDCASSPKEVLPRKFRALLLSATMPKRSHIN